MKKFIQSANTRIVKNIIYILILVLIFGIIFLAYKIEKAIEESENDDFAIVDDNSTLPTPDRIIYKNQNNEYIIIYPETKDGARIYSELYNRTTNTIEGDIYTESEITQMQDEGSFIEFDYNTKSKNFVFFLEEDEVGIIKRLTDSGQVIKTSLDDTVELINLVNELTEDEEKYDFNKDYNYTSNNKITEVPNELGFSQVKTGIYQKVISCDDDDYYNILDELNFETDNDMVDVDFEKQSVIITISQYNIIDVTQNIGNIKYTFGTSFNYYIVNVLVVSKVVNTNCIYYNLPDSTESSNSNGEVYSYNTIATGIITNIYDSEIEIGLSDNVVTYIAQVNDSIDITNYETNSKMQISDLKIGDSVYLLGETIEEKDDVKTIKANKIDVCPKEKIKSEVEKYLIDTYRVDTNGISYYDVDSDGNGFIIVNYTYEEFIYPIKLNVNSETETFLGMGYHLQSNYGYVLYEMCDITLDTKITDIDNISGVVKTIEYIAD